MEALQTLQDKMIDAHTQLKQLTAQQRAKEKRIRECALVSRQLEGLPSDVRLFKANGRAFFLAPKDVVMTGLEQTAAACGKELEGLKTGQSRVEQELKEIEQNVQELAKTSPELMSLSKPATSS